ALVTSAPAVERAAEMLGDLAQRDAPIRPRTTYRGGGAAGLFVDVATEDDLGRGAAAGADSGADVLVVGKGAHLLVAQPGVAGRGLSLGDVFATTRIDGSTVGAGGAASLPVVARQTVRAGLTGFEWAVGVPGSIGGAVRMNAGGHGSEMAE